MASCQIASWGHREHLNSLAPSDGDTTSSDGTVTSRETSPPARLILFLTVKRDISWRVCLIMERGVLPLLERIDALATRIPPVPARLPSVAKVRKIVRQTVRMYPTPSSNFSMKKCLSVGRTLSQQHPETQVKGLFTYNSMAWAIGRQLIRLSPTPSCQITCPSSPEALPTLLLTFYLTK